MIILFILAMTSSDAAMVSTSRGVYFKKLEGIKVYEHTTPVIYHFEIPKPPKIEEIKEIVKGIEGCYKTELQCLSLIHISEPTRPY